MGIWISNLENRQEDLSCNWWHWRTTVEIIRKSNVLGDDFDYETLSNGIGEISNEKVKEIIHYLETEIIPGINEQERILINLEKTSEPDDFKIYTGNETYKNYSTDLNWLKIFVEFLKTTNGIYISQ